MKRMLERGPASGPENLSPHLLPARSEAKAVLNGKSALLFSSEKLANQAEKRDVPLLRGRPGWIRWHSLYLKECYSSLRRDVLRAIPREERERVVSAIVGWVRSRFASSQLMERWWFEFKRDWMAMMNSLAFRQRKAALLHWLRQPTSSKS